MSATIKQILTAATAGLVTAGVCALSRKVKLKAARRQQQASVNALLLDTYTTVYLHDMATAAVSATSPVEAMRLCNELTTAYRTRCEQVGIPDRLRDYHESEIVALQKAFWRTYNQFRKQA
jgi:hypothetical protein